MRDEDASDEDDEERRRKIIASHHSLLDAFVRRSTMSTLHAGHFVNPATAARSLAIRPTTT
jgi:hypothetical protein